MSESQLSTDILGWLSDHASGHAQAKPRRMLLAYLCHGEQAHWPSPNESADRQMRKMVEMMPKVGSCGKGYFLIVTAEDRAVAQRTLHAPAMASLVRESEIRKSAPAGQMALFAALPDAKE